MKFDSDRNAEYMRNALRMCPHYTIRNDIYVHRQSIQQNKSSIIPSGIQSYYDGIYDDVCRWKMMWISL